MTSNGINGDDAGNEGGDGVVMAIAKFKFEGKNNDELSFEPNDIIIVTQQLDGGWWEGNIEGKIGWFPSNFCEIIPQDASDSTARLPNLEVSDKEIESNQAANRTAVIAEFLVKELAHLKELVRIQDTFLTPVSNSSSISNEEYAILACNLDEIIATKTLLLRNVDAETKKDPSGHRIGAVFLEAAPALKELLTQYCLNHPVAVGVVTSRQNQLGPILKAHRWELKELLGGLSVVFRHIEKYAVLLQEIERNYPDSHADRGNLQRASSVYRSIWQNCLFVRKQKEVQLEFLAQGYLEEWFGETFPDILGPLVHIGGVTIGSARESVLGALADRKIAVFSKMILFLESTADKYHLSDTVDTTDLVITKSDAKMSLEFKKGNEVRAFVHSLTNDDFQSLVEALASCGEGLIFDGSALVAQVAPATPQHAQTVRRVEEFSEALRPQKAEVVNLPQASEGFRLDHELQMVIPDAVESTDKGKGRPTRVFNGHCLMPYPAPRGGFGADEVGRIKLRRGMTNEEVEDMENLRLVEGYVSRASSSGIGASVLHSTTSMSHGLQRAPSYSADRPPLIVAEQEKILVEEREGDQVVFRERTLVDTVYNMTTEMAQLKKQVAALTEIVEKGERARRRIEEYCLSRDSHGHSLSISSTPKPTERDSV
uniref:SH3 domain-containing protein n=1 Tax=Panagrellus redivivus TaxID=6233 RepID=A0A7E4V0Z3_PANRE